MIKIAVIGKYRHDRQDIIHKLKTQFGFHNTQFIQCGGHDSHKLHGLRGIYYILCDIVPEDDEIFLQIKIQDLKEFTKNFRKDLNKVMEEWLK